MTMKTIITAINCYLFTLFACLAGNLSVETIGAIRHPNFDNPVWGAGIDLGYKLNSFVTLHGRAIGYETDSWRGGAVDEGSIYASAMLFSSANQGLKLAATAGGHRDFHADDWGFGVGLRPSLTIIKNRLDLFGASELRAWFNHDKDLLTTFGLSLKF
jgi:hypothetical protein